MALHTEGKSAISVHLYQPKHITFIAKRRMSEKRWFLSHKLNDRVLIRFNFFAKDSTRVANKIAPIIKLVEDKSFQTKA